MINYVQDYNYLFSNSEEVILKAFKKIDPSFYLK
jgi:hypothetical protein